MTLTLDISKLAYGGEGLAFADGKACFVEGALPGESVSVEVVQEKSNFTRARLLKVLEASPHRVTPPCHYAAQCGGCQYQHAAYEEELRWKELQVREYFQKELRLPAEITAPIRHTGKPYGYRHAVTLHAAAKGQRPGYFARDNRSLIAVDECLLAAPGLSPVFSEGRPAQEAGDRTYRLAADGRVISDQKPVLFQMEAGRERFWTHSQSFFQNNPEVAALMAEQAAAWTRAVAPEVFLDLYAGCGFFGLSAAPDACHVIFVEENPGSLEALDANLRTFKRQAVILKGEVERVIPKKWESLPAGRRMVFLDPPRKGIGENLALLLAREDAVDALIYVSCHLGTLVRDLKKMVSPGGLSVREVIPFDMFPRTKHIEIAVLLTRS